MLIGIPIFVKNVKFRHHDTFLCSSGTLGTLRYSKRKSEATLRYTIIFTRINIAKWVQNFRGMAVRVLHTEMAMLEYLVGKFGIKTE